VKLTIATVAAFTTQRIKCVSLKPKPASDGDVCAALKQLQKVLPSVTWSGPRNQNSTTGLRAQGICRLPSSFFFDHVNT